MCLACEFQDYLVQIVGLLLVVLGIIVLLTEFYVNISAMLILLGLAFLFFGSFCDCFRDIMLKR